jgi:hypothetical protein
MEQAPGYAGEFLDVVRWRTVGTDQSVYTLDPIRRLLRIGEIVDGYFNAGRRLQGSGCPNEGEYLVVARDEFAQDSAAGSSGCTAKRYFHLGLSLLDLFGP